MQRLVVSHKDTHMQLDGRTDRHIWVQPVKFIRALFTTTLGSALRLHIDRYAFIFILHISSFFCEFLKNWEGFKNGQTDGRMAGETNSYLQIMSTSTSNNIIIIFFTRSIVLYRLSSCCVPTQWQDWRVLHRNSIILFKSAVNAEKSV